MSSVDDYLETQVLTASPHRLHLLVVDGALRFAKRGLAALELGRWEDLFNALSRCRDCVSELLGGLQHEHAPEIAGRMRDLFLFVFRCLALADLEHDPQRLRDAIRILEMHRETWLALEEKLQREGGADVVPAPHSRSWLT